MSRTATGTHVSHLGVDFWVCSFFWGVNLGCEYEPYSHPRKMRAHPNNPHRDGNAVAVHLQDQRGVLSFFWGCVPDHSFYMVYSVHLVSSELTMLYCGSAVQLFTDLLANPLFAANFLFDRGNCSFLCRSLLSLHRNSFLHCADLSLYTGIVLSPCVLSLVGKLLFRLGHSYQ
jgi:hypothetical protein